MLVVQAGSGEGEKVGNGVGNWGSCGKGQPLI